MYPPLQLNVLIALMALLPSSSGAPNPKMQSVRAIVAAVKAGIAKRALTISHRYFEYCEPYADTKRTLAVEPGGRVRLYKREAGSEDSSVSSEHYYDGQGRLRFVYIVARTVKGTVLSHHIYFDETGKRIHEDHTYKKGPRHTFPEVWLIEDLQLAGASEAFASRSPCPELRGAVK